jgi:hypothetical protein
VLRHLAQQQAEPACFCRRCLSALARHAVSANAPEQILALARAEFSAETATPDFYLDEHGRTVFTAAYHLKRGFCCDNGCCHCPYQGKQKSTAVHFEQLNSPLRLTD